jgi:hypothetical protein
MKPSDELFGLIKSLTPHEKRHFRLYVAFSSAGKEAGYLRLFDAIDKMEVYDEAALKKKYSSERFIKQLAYNKNYLLHSIAKSMALYHSENSVQIQLMEMLKQIEFFFKKEQYALCRKWIKKAKEMAIKNELYIVSVHLLSWETKIEMTLTNPAQSIALIDAQVVTLEKQITNLRYKKAVQLLHNILLKGNDANKKSQPTTLEKIYTDYKLDQIEANADFGSQYYFYAANSLFYLIHKLPKMQAVYTEKIVALLETKAYFIEEEPKVYVAALYNHCVAILKIGQSEEVLKYIKKMRAFAVKDAEHLNEIALPFAYMLSYELELHTNITTGAVDKAVALENTITSMLATFGKNIPVNAKLIIIYNMAMAFFMAPQYEKSLDWLHIILDEHRADCNADMYMAARLMFLLNHFELRNDMYIENSVDSTVRYLKNKKQLGTIENAILSFLRQKSKQLNVGVDKKEWKILHHKLQPELLNNANVINRYIDFNSWLLAKINGKSIATVVKQQYLKKAK